MKLSRAYQALAGAAISLMMINVPAAHCEASSTYLPLGAEVSPPRGYLEFCARDPSECAEVSAANVLPRAAGGSQSEYWRLLFASIEPASIYRGPSSPPAVQLNPLNNAAPLEDTPMSGRQVVEITPETWKILNETNQRINRAITPRSDKEVYGRDDYWAEPIKDGIGYGDCEDYVLEKRRALRAKQIPESAMSIALVRTTRGEDHAVLLVATARGEVVLDSLSSEIVSWKKANYRWLTRQNPFQPNHWIAVAGQWY